MKVYSIFDDFTDDAQIVLCNSGADVTIHPSGVPRPDHDQMKKILETYDCVIIGTSQKITEDMFDNIALPRIIATASVGIDHIKVPEEKKELVTILNTPKANAQSVAEYTVGCALSCVKRLNEGSRLYKEGKDNKALYRKPEDLSQKTIGIIGAGNISSRIIDYANFFDMNILCWTRNPNHHKDLEKKNVHFVSLDFLIGNSDIISMNIPANEETKGFLTKEHVVSMKKTAIFISVSRLSTFDMDALLEKAKENAEFYVCVDIDIDKTVVNRYPNQSNVIITPHIAGGTIETRKRMFREVANQIALII